jgi:hypothetical protein
MSLLTIIQDVCGRLSLDQPASVIGNSDKQVSQLLALSNQGGKDLASRAYWQALRTEFTFVTLAQIIQTGFVPADWDRWCTGTFWNRTTRRPVLGPITPAQWQTILAQPVFASVYLVWVERQGQVLMQPTPVVGQTIAGEYISKDWVKSLGTAGPPIIAAGNYPRWQTDADTAYLDEELLTLDLTWRFMKRKGLDYAEDFATFETNVEQVIGRDGGAATLSMVPQAADLNRINLPDGNFPGP